jgi:hypothetical protein
VERLAPTLAPLLNRLVFTGRLAVELLQSDKSLAVHPPPTEDIALVDVLTDSALDRIAQGLALAGLSRSERGDRWERWLLDRTVELHVRHVDEGPEGSNDQTDEHLAWAFLMTMPIALGAGLTIRFTGAPAMLGTLWAEHVAAGARVTESPALEDCIELVARRQEVERELRASPAALRRFVAAHCASFAKLPSATWVIARVLPDARRLPALAQRVRDRFRRLGELGDEG